MADLEDWIVLDDGIPIGRIYQRHAPANADVAGSGRSPLMSNALGSAHERDHGNARRSQADRHRAEKVAPPWARLSRLYGSSLGRLRKRDG